MLLGSSSTQRPDPPTDSDRLAPVEHARFEAKGLLIVDDEPGIRSALVRMLRRDGYRILTAESGEAGLQLLATTAVQVIISDQRMPGMVGTEFLARVQRDYPDTVRIILSGYSELQVVTEAIDSGAVYKLLTKPWEDAQLRGQVRAAFERHRQARIESTNS